MVASPLVTLERFIETVAEVLEHGDGKGSRRIQRGINQVETLDIVDEKHKYWVEFVY